MSARPLTPRRRVPSFPAVITDSRTNIYSTGSGRRLATPNFVVSPLAVRHRVTPALSIRLLGRFELARNGAVVPLALGSQRLLVFVALASGPVRRDTAAGRLWPEVPERRAHANLRAALARLRGRAPVLRADALEIALADRVRVDLDDGRAMA
jgi:hypothetical protein